MFDFYFRLISSRINSTWNNVLRSRIFFLRIVVFCSTLLRSRSSYIMLNADLAYC